MAELICRLKPAFQREREDGVELNAAGLKHLALQRCAHRHIFGAYVRSNLLA